MATYVALGWPADWVNAWLAAVGVTVLLDDVALSWTDDPLPVAEFHGDVSELPSRLFAALPDDDELGRWAISRRHGDVGIVGEFDRNPSIEVFRERAAWARRTGDFTLQATVTDLDAAAADGLLAHGRFDPPVPKGITVFERFEACWSRLVQLGPSAVDESLAGRAVRQALNGLGFDFRRLQTPTAPGADPFVDVAVEVFALIGLAFVPGRGDGQRSSFRSWSAPPRGAPAFRWPVWHERLLAAGIDGLLDRFEANPGGGGRGYRTVAYQAKGTSDTTRGYAATALP